MAKISQDIKDLLKKDTSKRSKWAVKAIYFLALVGLAAIIAGSVMTCQNEESPAPSVLEEAK